MSDMEGKFTKEIEVFKKNHILEIKSLISEIKNMKDLTAEYKKRRK